MITGCREAREVVVPASREQNIMLERYVAFCAAHPVFYEPLELLADAGSEFDATRRPTPAGWTRTERDIWVALSPPRGALLKQGWKVHVSAGLARASEVIDLVWEYCVTNYIAFKHLRSRRIYLMCNAKYAPRASSGKLMTLYPGSDEQLRSVLNELSAKLRGHTGPYILSDLRWSDGPLYIRYGGFAERYCLSSTGEPVPAIETPDGTLVSDERIPAFSTPEWAPVPGFIADAIQAFADDDDLVLPYDVQEALHFSNGGGIYKARDPHTGRSVILREARPAAGLDRDGHDAVSRLNKERLILEELAGLDFVPQVLGSFVSWEHHFIAEEYFEGETLWQYVVRCNPSVRPDPAAADISTYTENILGILRQLEDAVAVLHERGVVFGDLQFKNIIVRPGGKVALVDFEAAFHPASDPAPALVTPGFSSAEHRDGTAIDSYAMDCLRLAVFLPLTEMLEQDPGIAGLLIDSAADLFRLPGTYADGLRAGLAGRPGALNRDVSERFRGDLARGVSSYERLRAALAEAIASSATPGRTDRLFPGDVNLHPHGGHTLAHGAAGVLHAMQACGADIDPGHVQWLADAARRARFPRPGLYDGLHGTGYVLHQLGRVNDALNVIDHALGLIQHNERTSLGLFSGLSGIALALLRLAQATGDGGFRAVAMDLADRIAGVVHPEDDTSSPALHAGAGLLHGFSGPALLFVELYKDTGDHGFLDLAAAALNRELLRCKTAEDGSVNLLDDRNRLLPYLGEGSAGVGLALHSYLKQRQDERLQESLAGIQHAARVPFTIQPNLFRGRAGLMAFLAQTGEIPSHCATCGGSIPCGTTPQPATAPTYA